MTDDEYPAHIKMQMNQCKDSIEEGRSALRTGSKFMKRLEKDFWKNLIKNNQDKLTRLRS